MSPVSGQLKRPWIQILLALADEERHGYGIMNEVLERTGGRTRLWPGVLYGALKQMVNEGLIVETDHPEGAPDDRRERRFYTITPVGRRGLRDEIRKLEEVVEAARRKNVLTERET